MTDWVTEVSLGYAGVIIGALGLLAATVFYIKSRRYSRAYYGIKTDRLIGGVAPSYKGLDIVYNGKSIRSFSSSKVFIWNDGTRAIRSSDIALSSPIVISVRVPEQLLDHRILYCSSKHNQIKAKRDVDGRIIIDFDFLDPKQGIIIEVIHTGGMKSIEVEGSIIEGGEIKWRKSDSGRLSFKGMLFNAVGLSILLSVMFSVARIDYFESYPVVSSITLVLFIVVALIISEKLRLRWFIGFSMVDKLHYGYAQGNRTRNL